MNLDQQQLAKIVSQIVNQLQPDTSTNNYMFQTVDSAVVAAKQAQQQLVKLTLKQRQQILEVMRTTLSLNAQPLAEKVLEITGGMGKVADKVTKVQLAVQNSPGVEDLTATAFTGDNGLTLNECSPYGVSVVIVSCRFALETLVANALNLIAAGNSVIFYPYQAVIPLCQQVIALLEQALKTCHAPSHLISMVQPDIADSLATLLKHPKVDLLVACGGNAISEYALSFGKKTIATGSAFTPVVVDETADIEQASKDIIAGASFDHNMSCGAEKAIIAVESIADYLLHQLVLNGAYLIQDSHLEKRLLELLVDDKQQVKMNYRARSATELLSALGISSKASLIVLEVKEEHPFLQLDLVAPVLPLVRVANVNKAIDLACDIEQGNRHTAVMHSKHIDHLTLCARALQTVMFIKNAPSYAGLGVKGEGFTSFVVAAKTGEGATSPKDFSRRRRCVLSEGFLIK